MIEKPCLLDTDMVSYILKNMRPFLMSVKRIFMYIKALT